MTDDEVSKWASFVTAQNIKAGVTISQAKGQWQRLRPFKAHADIHPCIKLEGSYSYPSGHSALAEFDARILEVAFPERAAAFEARAKQIALDRTIGGVHYPTDIRDGNLLGNQIFDEQNQNGSLEQEIHQHP